MSHISNNGIVNIHGNPYVTVAERVRQFHADNADAEHHVDTELVPNTGDAIVFRATVRTPRGTFTGYSAVIPSQAKNIEKENPYEVAETSALGRALGFAGYGLVDGIASADEMVKAGAATNQGKEAAALARTQARLDAKFGNQDLTPAEQEMKEVMDEAEAEVEALTCTVHDVAMTRGFSKTKVDEFGNPKEYWSHVGPNGRCFGSGYRD